MLCWREAETEEHLFYKCAVARQLWKRLKVFMGQSRTAAATMEMEMRWLKQTHTNKVQHDGVRLVFAAFIYWLWRARNDKIFSGKASTVSSLYEQITSEVRMKLQAQQYQMMEGPERYTMENRWGIIIGVKRRIKERVRWIKPPEDMVKLRRFAKTWLRR